MEKYVILLGIVRIISIVRIVRIVRIVKFGRIVINMVIIHMVASWHKVCHFGMLRTCMENLNLKNVYFIGN